ncbi:MFS transporter [Dacryopinax primogenitus]|uniref:MFS transporter n=1 Tax=Dacryopinax primogenitus (strain DJM 731) TaxID=1858805 RepID=M5G7I4_DACPD|nr:MFS transporter [Dacryopinax primogenitus]EJT99727.1 MFS transporter [Dacryopinax primogenitus]
MPSGMYALHANIKVTEEDDARIRSATDLAILPVLCWVYFLQILDKSVVGYNAVVGLEEDAYSILGSAGYVAQLALQPLSAYLLVLLPDRTLLAALVFSWGISLTLMAFARSFVSLLVTRFLLGVFEAVCLPVVTLIVGRWWRRGEQPIRVGAFYSTNSLATILGSLLVFLLALLHAPFFKPYQLIFLTTGLLTVLSSPMILISLPSSPSKARFLTPSDRMKAVRRLASSHQSDGTHDFQWYQARECLFEMKTWLFCAMTLLLNVGASVTNVFGPLIVHGLSGGESKNSVLWNIPFGAVQFAVILLSSWVAVAWRRKGAVLLVLVLPMIAGYGFGRGQNNQAVLLIAYYLLGFLFGGNPLLVSWIAGNYAGETKRSVAMSLYQASSSLGNILGPFLFRSTDAPYYYSGLRATLVLSITLFGLVFLQIVHLNWLNKKKEKKRVAKGKPAMVRDTSMMKRYVEEEDANGMDEPEGTEDDERSRILRKPRNDLSDPLMVVSEENDEFVYIL